MLQPQKRRPSCKGSTLAVLPREGREGPPLQEAAAARNVFIRFRGFRDPKSQGRNDQKERNNNDRSSSPVR
jgi:hypothetical protein